MTTTTINPHVLIADAIAIGVKHGVVLPGNLPGPAIIAFIKDAVTEKARHYKEDIRNLGRLQRALAAEPDGETPDLFDAPAGNSELADTPKRQAAE